MGDPLAGGDDNELKFTKPGDLPFGYVLGSDGFIYKEQQGARGGKRHTRVSDAELNKLNFTPEGGGGAAQTRNIGGRVLQWNPETNRYDIDLGASGGEGLTFDERLQLEREPNVSLSLTDPNRLALDREQLGESQRQFDEREERERAEFEAQQQLAQQQLQDTLARTQLQRAQLDEQMRANQANEAYLLDKFSLEESLGRARDARETRGMLFNEQTTIANLGLQIQQLDMQSQQLETEIAQFNAQQEFAVDRENQRRREQQAADRRQNAADIGSLSTEAGDRGKLASFLLAQGGNVGGLSTAIGQGEDFRGGEGAAALGELLTEQAMLEQDPELAQFNPIQAPERPDSSGILTRLMQSLQNLPAAGAVPAVAPAATQAAQTPSAPAPRFSGQANDPALRQAASGPISDPAEREAIIEALNRANQLPRKADGGMVEGAYIGDEEGSEVHIPIGPGQAFVIDHDDAKQAGLLSKQLAKMQDGGLFASTLFGGRTEGNIERARGFLNAALLRALAGTPFEQSGVPTPVGVSAPGTSRFVQDQAASITALGTGVPMGLFKEEAQRARPRGILEGVTRRTA